MSTLLSVSNLSKAFGGIKAVDQVSFSLAEGELLALIGPNGAGKSTCFNMLSGQLKPDQGTIRYKDAPITGLPSRTIWRKGIGRTFQITATYASMSVIENVQMALISAHRRTLSLLPYAHRLYRHEALDLLALVGLDNQAERPASILAYGDLKRLELAIALANKPALLLMDEPTAGVAPEERHALMDRVAELVQSHGLSVLFTEHDMDVVFSHADRIMVLDRGRLIAEGHAEAIRADETVRAVYLGSGKLAHAE